MEQGGAGSATLRAPRIQFRLEEGSGPRGPRMSSVAAGQPRLGGLGTATVGHPDSSAPPTRPYCARGEGARCSQGPRREASPSPGPLHPGPRPPARDSPWIPRGPDPPLPASRRTTRGKKEEAPADSAIVTAAAAAAAQQRPARARAPPAPPLLPRPRSRLPLLRPAPARALPAEPAPRPPRAPPKGGAGCARAPALKGSVPVKGVGGARASATSRVGAERFAERPESDTRPPPWPAPRPVRSYQHRSPSSASNILRVACVCSCSIHPRCLASSPHHVSRLTSRRGPRNRPPCPARTPAVRWTQATCVIAYWGAPLQNRARFLMLALSLGEGAARGTPILLGGRTLLVNSLTLCIKCLKISIPMGWYYSLSVSKK